MDWWDDIVNSQGWPPEAHDTVDWLISENISNIFSQPEDLLFDGKSGEGQDVSGQVTIARSRSVLDGEGGSGLGAEGRRFARVEAVFGVARFWVPHAGLAGALDVDDPVVGRAGIGDDGELLWWGSGGDVLKVEVIVVVADLRRAGLLDAEGIKGLAPETLLDELGLQGRGAPDFGFVDSLRDDHSGKPHHNGGQEEKEIGRAHV